jgi:hypothetical protein
VHDDHQVDFAGKNPRFECIPKGMAMGILKAPIKKSTRTRQANRKGRFVSGADVLADAAERMGDSRLRVSRKGRKSGSR